MEVENEARYIAGLQPQIHSLLFDFRLVCFFFFFFFFFFFLNCNECSDEEERATDISDSSDLSNSEEYQEIVKEAFELMAKRHRWKSSQFLEIYFYEIY